MLLLLNKQKELKLGFEQEPQTEGRRPRLFADRCVPSAQHGTWVGEASESAQQDTFERQATHTQRRKARKADVHELEN